MSLAAKNSQAQNSNLQIFPEQKLLCEPSLDGRSCPSTSKFPKAQALAKHEQHQLSLNSKPHILKSSSNMLKLTSGVQGALHPFRGRLEPPNVTAPGVNLIEASKANKHGSTLVCSG